MDNIQDELSRSQGDNQIGQRISQSLTFHPENEVFSFFQSENKPEESDSQYSIEECGLKLRSTSIKSNCKESENITNQYQKGIQENQAESNIPTENSVSEINDSVNIQVQGKFADSLNNQQQQFEQSFSKIAQLQYNSISNNLPDQDKGFLIYNPAKDGINLFLDKKIKEQEHKKVTNILNTENNCLQNDLLRDDSEMLAKMTILKKKQCHGVIKEWQATHIEQIDFHLSMINLLLDQIDNRVSSSTENLEIYERYFRDRAKQQQKYYESQVINIQNCLKDNIISSCSYKKISSVIFFLHQEERQKCKKVKDFCDLINENIIKNSIQKHLAKSKKQLMVIREQISAKKSLLKKCSQNLQHTNQKLNRKFDSMPKEQLNIDIHTQMRRMGRRAIKEAIIQKELGELAIQYLKQAITQDKIRIQIIRQSWLIYSKGLSETYHVQIDKQEMQQMTKMEQQLLIDQLYSIESLFDQNQIKLFKNKLHLNFQQNFEQQHFQQFLLNFKIKKIDIRVSILKQYNVNMVIDKKQYQCTLVITVDQYLLCFINSNKIFTDPDLSFLINDCYLQIKSTGSTTTQIKKSYKKSSTLVNYFWDSKKSQCYKVSFPNQDFKDQFMDAIKKITKK